MEHEGQPDGSRPMSLVEYLQEKYPDFQPVSGPPSLITINGIGLTIYGERDHDAETNTYVKTQCLALVFVPVLWLRAYRVADAAEGWYFVGRHRLSPLARGWNVLVLAAILTAITLARWSAHTSTPQYKAQQTLSRAQEAEAAGDLPAATRDYLALANGPRHAQGLAALREILGRTAKEGSLAQVRDLVGKVAASSYERDLVDPAALEALAKRALDGRQQDPAAALALGRALRALHEGAWEQLAEPLLEAAAGAGDPAVASELARIYEGRDELDRAEALLAPLADRLGTTDGARILGQALARRGDLEGAHRLLVPWLEARLDQLHAAEQRFDQEVEAGQKRAFAALNANRAGAAWYARYERADEAEQERMVIAWVQTFLRDDAALKRAREQLEAVSDVVPVALDLGMVKLQRAQGLAGQARTDELQAAEKVFLAVRGVAEGSATFQLGLAQVYYWLGREADGKQLIDQLLEADRSTEALLGVARVLREVGHESACLPLVEEAYEKETDEKKRHGIAAFRAVIEDDADDRITWLERAGSDPHVQASLAESRGRKALQQGDRAAAARHLRASVDQYRKMPEDATTLNNAALALRLLYGAAGDRAAFDEHVDMLARAERLEQGSSIVKSNLAHSLMGRAALRAATTRELDLPALRLEPELDLLEWLYADAAGRAALTDPLLRDADLAEAGQRLNALRVLAPKAAGHHRLTLQLLALDRRLEPHQALVQSLEAAGLDHAASAGEIQALLAPPEPSAVEAARGHAEQLERLRDGLAGATRVTRGVCLGSLVQARLGLFALGEAVDLDAVVALAEEARRHALSQAARDTLQAALLARGSARVAARTPAFADLRRRMGRTLSPAQVVAAALRGPEAGLREALVADEDVRRAAALAQASISSLPEELGAESWALIQAVDPEAGAALARRLAADQVGQLRRKAWLLLYPMAPSCVLPVAWERQALGDAAGAEAVLAEAASRGVPLPFGP